MQRFNVSEDMLPYVIAFNAVGEQVSADLGATERTVRHDALTVRTPPSG